MGNNFGRIGDTNVEVGLYDNIYRILTNILQLIASHWDFKTANITKLAYAMKFLLHICVQVALRSYTVEN